MKYLLQRLIRLAGGYDFYLVLEKHVPAEEAVASVSAIDIRLLDEDARRQLLLEPEAKPRQLAGVQPPSGSVIYALWQGMALLAVAVFEPADLGWIASIWPYAGNGIALTDIWTMTSARDGGAATTLVESCSQQFATRHLVAWTWWTNRPALRVFEKLGWRRVGWSIRIGRLPRIVQHKGRFPRVIRGA